MILRLFNNFLFLVSKPTEKLFDYFEVRRAKRKGKK